MAAVSQQAVLAAVQSRKDDIIANQECVRCRDSHRSLASHAIGIDPR